MIVRFHEISVQHVSAMRVVTDTVPDIQRTTVCVVKTVIDTVVICRVVVQIQRTGIVVLVKSLDRVRHRQTMMHNRVMHRIAAA